MGDQQPSIDKIKLVLSTELSLPEADVLEIMNLVNAKLSKVRMRSISRTPKQADISDLLQSLLTGEKEYVSNLNKMVKGYLMPIRTGIIKVKMQTMLGIFSNVDILLNVHTELLRDIESVVAGNNTLQSVFLRAVPSMKIYTQFVNNFSNAMDTLEEEKKKNKFFCAYIQQQDENNHMELETLLSMPLNRISQYQRTVNHVTKLTPESSEEYKQLADCLKELEMLQEYVNQSLIQSDNMSHIINVEKKVIGRESIALRDINRVFKREGAITQVESDKKIKDQYYFLFNDVLMTTKVIGKGSYKYKSLLPLQYGSLKDEDGLKFTVIGKDGVAQHFIANSPKEKEEWIKDFREVFDAMEKTKVFDTDLAVLMAREPPDALIPSFIEELLKYIEERALETAGIFRISASKMHVLSLIDQINRGISIDVPFLEDHVVANLLKQFLRNLPEPIIPFAFYDEFCAVYNSDDQVGCLKTLVQKLPDANRNLLKRLFQVLSKIAAKNEINMMTPSNLAIVIGPNLSRRRQESLAMDDFAATGASEVLVKDYETIFETQIPRSPRASASLSSQFAKAFVGTSPRPTGNASRPVLGKRAPASMIGNRTNRGTDSAPHSPLQSSASSSSLSSSSSSSSLTCSLPAIPTSDDEPEQSKPTESPPHEDLTKSDPDPSPPSSSSPSPVSSSANSLLSSLPTVTVPLRNAVKLPPPPSKARPTLEAQRKSLRAAPVSLQGAGSRKSVSTLPNPNKLSDDALKLELPPPPETLVADRLLAIGEDPSTLPPLTSPSSAPAIKKGPAPPGKRPITVKTACGACQKPIAGTGLKALNKSWHTECFVCTHCKKPFQAGEFVEYEGLPYCPDDYGSLFTDEEETCGRCNKPISDEMIEALDRSWHPECFACSVCAGDLSNGYFSKAGQPVCPNCKKL